MGGGLIAGAVALVVAGGLAVVTSVGLVNSVNKSPQKSDSSVVNYGQRS